jgi:integrase
MNLNGRENEALVIAAQGFGFLSPHPSVPGSTLDAVWLAPYRTDGEPRIIRRASGLAAVPRANALAGPKLWPRVMDGDRVPDRPVFPGLTQERLRTAIARACRASGTATWSPHDLRHRRISLWHRQGETWALIGARVGQRSLSVTADTYTHVLLDDRELDHPRLAADLHSHA